MVWGPALVKDVSPHEGFRQWCCSWKVCPDESVAALCGEVCHVDGLGFPKPGVDGLEVAEGFLVELDILILEVVGQAVKPVKVGEPFARVSQSAWFSGCL